MIQLHQPPPVWGLPAMSPFCVKLETYLRMAKIPYEVPTLDFRKAPKGKIPFATIDGKLIGDSSHIVEILENKFGHPVDGGLSPEQKAQGVAIRCLIEEHFYFAGAWLRWSDEESWQYVKVEFLKILPPVIGSLILKKIRKDFLKAIHGQGMGRHTREEIIQFAKDDLDALAVLLGDKAFFLGDKPSSIDASAYGFLVQQYNVPWRGPTRDHAESHKNLIAFCERMKKLYWN